MKTLKFRVYHPDLKEFKYFGLCDFLYADRYLHQHRYPVQQFTGLLDKNGKEIYEGDILNVKGYGDWFDVDGHDYKLTVKWKSEENGDVSESCGYLYIPKDREIIGNIFENENTNS